ncbi:MAG: hypothetical protein WCP14_02040 [bacterium]
MDTNDLAQRYNQEVADFFGTKPLKDIDVVLFDSQKDIITFYDKNRNDDIPAPDYLVGFSPQNHIYIIGPNGMPPQKDPGHIRFQKVLKHELVHKYLRPVSNKHTPGWLIEGVCGYVAGQSSTWTQEDINIQLLNKLSYTQNGDKYQVGITMVNLIMSEFGKEKLFNLASLEKNDERNIELVKMFPWLNKE